MENRAAFRDRRIPNELFGFDDFVLNVQARELSRGCTLLHTEPQVFDLLVELVHKQHRVVERGELSRFLWCDTVVCNGALDQCIATLRRVLGDSAREERYIRTIRRRGYRFVGRARLLAE
ncbi:MAG TPA: winged helix-turn-helix domain-containing protein [Polyangiales bacterium]